MVVSDEETTACGERLELLAVVRGLEALDGPAQVTLVTKSRYVSRGIRCGLTEWRANDWQWERFGRIVPVKDHDLWQRVDRALLFHKVDCQAWQFEEAATSEPLVCQASYQVGVGQVEAVGSRCSETMPNLGELPAVLESPRTEPESRLAPTKRRLVPMRRNRKRMAMPAERPNPLGRLTAAVVDKAASWGESLRTMGSPVRQMASGAA